MPINSGYLAKNLRLDHTGGWIGLETAQNRPLAAGCGPCATDLAEPRQWPALGRHRAVILGYKRGSLPPRRDRPHGAGLQIQCQGIAAQASARARRASASRAS